MGYNCIAITSIEFSDHCFCNIVTFATLSVDNVANAFNQPTKMNLAGQTPKWNIIFHFFNSFSMTRTWCTICWMSASMCRDAKNKVYLILPHLMNEININLQVLVSSVKFNTPHTLRVTGKVLSYARNFEISEISDTIVYVYLIDIVYIMIDN